MIYAVCLNPCIDTTVLCEHFDADRTNRVRPLRSDLGGKGINCARVLHALGVPVTLCGTEYRGEVKKALGDGFPLLLEETGLPLRVNLKIFDAGKKRTVEVNETGSELPARLTEAVKTLLLSRLEEGDTVLLSGSLPAGTPPEAYAGWCGEFRAKKARVIADCSGEALQWLLDAAPDLIKPNRGELEELMTRMGYGIPSGTKALAAACELLRERYGIGRVLLSLGRDGAMLSSDKGTFLCPPPPVEVCGDIGAGDAMTAAAAWRLSENADDADLLLWTAAAAGAVLIREGTDAPNGSTVRALISRCGPVSRI